MLVMRQVFWIRVVKGLLRCYSLIINPSPLPEEFAAVLRHGTRNQPPLGLAWERRVSGRAAPPAEPSDTATNAAKARPPDTGQRDLGHFFSITEATIFARQRYHKVLAFS